MGIIEVSKNVINEMKGKSSVSNKRILDLVDECINLMKGINFGFVDEDILTYNDIDVEEGDALKTFGTMSLPAQGNPNNNFRLVLNKYMFDDDAESIKNTILHELCHYVVYKLAIDKDYIYSRDGAWYLRKNRPYANDYNGHGKMWKYVASKVGSVANTDITRTNNYSQHQGVRDYAMQQFKYYFRCKNCGAEFGFKRKTEFVDTYDAMSTQHPNRPRWFCNKCRKGARDGDEPTFEKIKG